MAQNQTVRFALPLLLLIVLRAGPASSQSLPAVITYQGSLAADDGTLITDTRDLTFRLYQVPSAGFDVWSEAHSDVPVADGLFTVQLGSITPFGAAEIVFDRAYWLEVEVSDGSSSEVLAPRTQLTVVPYAFRALRAGDPTVNNFGRPSVAIGGGNDNAAVAEWASIGGGRLNRVQAKYGTISGGGPAAEIDPESNSNKVFDNWGTIGGGGGNTVGSDNGNDLDATFSTVAGGSSNSASGSGATISGGRNNAARGSRSVVGGGEDNTALAIRSTVSGGGDNIAGNTNATVGGGSLNTAAGEFSTVAGGVNNTSGLVEGSGEFATVSGGSNNLAAGSESTVSGGRENAAQGRGSVIGGGIGNESEGRTSAIVGGTDNVASAVGTFVGGGQLNRAAGLVSTVAGGSANQTLGDFSGILAGNENIANGRGSVIGGGEFGIATGARSVIGGGLSNRVGDGEGNPADVGTIAGGQENSVLGEGGTIGGGVRNVASGSSTVGGGSDNGAEGTTSVVVGGSGNTARNAFGVVVGGSANTAFTDLTFVGGGLNNVASGIASVVAGGDQNSTVGDYSVVSGGRSNGMSDAEYGTISGGRQNRIAGRLGTVGGGAANDAGIRATVGGGQGNLAGGEGAAISGGRDNHANGQYGAVPGGRSNSASGRFSFAAGQRAKALHAGTFVWSDNQSADFASTDSAQFLVRAENGVGFNVASPTTGFDVAKNVDGLDSQVANYVARIRNLSGAAVSGANGLAITVESGIPAAGTNFLGFFLGSSLLGSVEGNGSGGVAFRTSGGDYAEMLPVADPSLTIPAGSIVGVRSGRISLDTRDADRLMVVTDRPAVIGNASPHDSESHRPVAFVGQVPVTVRGTVRSGDLVVASGRNEGSGSAVSPSLYDPAVHGPIVGQAWSNKPSPSSGPVNVAVGLVSADAFATSMSHLESRLNSLERRVQRQTVVLRTLLEQSGRLASGAGK